jgi:uncharacterized protein YkwD
MRKQKRMYNIVITIIVTLVLIVTVFPNQLNLVNPADAGKYGDIIPTSFEIELLDKINENRTENAAPPLKLNTTLWWVARAHSQDMIDNDFFDHTSSIEGPFNGATFKERVNNYAEYENSYIGECIAMRSSGIDPEWCMAAWKGSPPHWDIIINPNLKEVGIGILQGEWEGNPNAGLYTADFGGPLLSVDLTLDSSGILFDPPSPYQGEEVTITATIENHGSTDAFPVNVKFYDGDPNSGGTQIGEEKQIPHILIHDESAEVSTIWNTQGESGIHNIYVVIDENNIISETNENNNEELNSVSINASNSPIHLDFGWNLISFPYTRPDSSLDSVLSTISGKYDIVQYYDSSDSADPWKNHNSQKPIQLNDLAQLDNKMGFWIHITEPGGTDLFVDGSMPGSPQTIPLKKGWNLVGYPSSSKTLRDNALNNLAFDNEIDAIQYHDTNTDKIMYLGSNDKMEPGLGYWLHATKNCEWIVNL